MLESTDGTAQASAPRRTRHSTAAMIFWRLALAFASNFLAIRESPPLLRSRLRPREACSETGAWWPREAAWRAAARPGAVRQAGGRVAAPRPGGGAPPPRPGRKPAPPGPPLFPGGAVAGAAAGAADALASP